jgi:hypothetical protein
VATRAGEVDVFAWQTASSTPVRGGRLMIGLGEPRHRSRQLGQYESDRNSVSALVSRVIDHRTAAGRVPRGVRRARARRLCSPTPIHGRPARTGVSIPRPYPSVSPQHSLPRHRGCPARAGDDSQEPFEQVVVGDLEALAASGHDRALVEHLGELGERLALGLHVEDPQAAVPGRGTDMHATGEATGRSSVGSSVSRRLVAAITRSRSSRRSRPSRPAAG